MIALLERLLAHRLTERFILGLILANAVVLGLETEPAVVARFGGLLAAVDRFALSVVVVELLTKLLVQRGRFVRDPWNLFDFVVVAIALLPTTGPLAVLRALRVLRVLRLVTVVPSLRRVVGALLGALPGMGSIVMLLGLLFYVGAVMATKLYGESFPDWFGSVPASLYTLFQVMTLESWSMGIVRPVMEQHPGAWLFFVPFILATSFTALNLFIGVVVSAMQSEVDAERKKSMEDAVAHAEEPLLAEVRALRAELAQLARRLDGDQPKKA